jgi:ATP dependent DNA ligase C terminal region
VHDVCRIARAPETAEDVASLNYAVFAIYDLDGVDMVMQPMEQLAKIRKLFSGGTRVHPMETVEGSEADIQAKFQQWVVTEGGEGLVVRSEKFGWYKIKPRHTIDVAVIGYSHGIEDRAGMLHSLLLALVREDGTYHVIGRTGGGFSDEQRNSMVDDLAKLVVESTYAEVNSDRVAYKMIKPGLVAEISCLDIISETSDGSTIDRMVIEWDAGASSWAGVRRLPFASIISPQFEKLRTDKVASVDDTGLSQLTRVIELPDDAVGVQWLHLPKAEIMKRAVATKELKGKTMVRKLLLWKTNKEQLSPDYPAYVLLLTDYSPNRKTPLEREIRVSASLEQIEGYWTTWSTENFVKGWVMK